MAGDHRATANHNTSTNKAKIVSNADSSRSYAVPLFEKDQIQELLKSM